MKTKKPNISKKIRVTKKVNLHLGCWKRNIPGFINVDICDLPHIHYKRSVDDLSIFPNSRANLIYASHVFEYFDRVKGKEVLKEWYRVLAPGGVLRLAVPDFEKLVTVYKKYKTLDKIIGPLFGRMPIMTKKGENILYHKTVYDFESLKNILESVGFKKVRRYDWKKTIHKDYDDHSQAYIPHMDKKHGLLISLNVEANK